MGFFFRPDLRRLDSARSCATRLRSKRVSAARAQQEVEDELFAGLDNEQRAQLLSLLTTLQDGLAGAHGTPCSADAARDHGHPFEAGCLPTSDDRSST